MNCRDFLSEFEERNALTEPATLHLDDCADCRKTTVVQTRVWQVIDRFEPVSAPNDFNFRVKARIADSKPSRFKPQFLPVLRYVLPLGLVVLISTFAVFNSLYFTDSSGDVARIVEPQPQAMSDERKVVSSVPETLSNAQPEATSVNSNVAQSNEKKPLETFVAASRPVKTERSGSEPKTTLRRKSSDDSFKGYQTLSSTYPTLMVPPGLSANKTVTISPEFKNDKPLTAKEILSQLGIEATFTSKGWLVKTVKQNSLAERSTVKVDDLIEAIDGEKLTGEPMSAKSGEGKKLTVVRGSEKKEILLRNQSN